ncbi:MAG: Uracil phosphoribosyltransferase [Alphaproteobacteria bacterium MarineAlpha5_Bin5]|nr:MAG: Uracil phosphoribosyltransferase [Alphaproteobacteria bacterium MarineAlpha5_Bin5]PPR52749.1 MAG: Uracil phosphoribosyltransferase [Alphaproteobacteria bacterium MarineAlpha5_Bin4]|tara:strand:+ start:2309 stop:2929 length:621 start_codon:yes stop_codon:yes gene_type:complete
MITSIQSPFLEYKLTILRDKKTSNSLFRQTMNEASYLIASEVLKFMPYKKISVQTPLTTTFGKKLSQKIILVPILRAGLGLLEGFVKFLPDAEKGHIGLYRNEQTYEPVEYLFKLPKTKNKKVLVLDPMLATGNSSIAAINLIKGNGVKTKDVFLISLLAAPEGLKNLQKNHKSLHIFTCKIDSKLNKKKFILPGLGDAGDRYMGT